MAHIHGSSFVNSLRLRAGNKLLKIWIVADRVPDGIDFQTRNGNELTRPASECFGRGFGNRAPQVENDFVLER